MNSTRAEEIGRDQRDLHAYHDGELRGLRRWLFERRLSRSPRLRAELEELKRLAQWVQGVGAQRSSADVWDHVALRLPAIDAQLSEQRQGRAGQPRGRGERSGWTGWPPTPGPSRRSPSPPRWRWRCSSASWRTPRPRLRASFVVGHGGAQRDGVGGPG